MSIASRSNTSFSQQNTSKEADYLIDHCGEALQSALSEIQTLRPKDPIEYLAKYLYKYVENTKYQKQVEIDSESLKTEILQYEEEIRISKEREDERKKLQLEEEQKRKMKELEDQKRKEEEEAALKAEEEAAKALAEKEAEEAAEALRQESLKNAEAANAEISPIAAEDGKLPPVVETDELEYSTREPTKVETENGEENVEVDLNNEDAENLDDQTINEEPDE